MEIKDILISYHDKRERYSGDYHIEETRNIFKIRYEDNSFIFWCKLERKVSGAAHEEVTEHETYNSLKEARDWATNRGVLSEDYKLADERR